MMKKKGFLFLLPLLLLSSCSSPSSSLSSTSEPSLPSSPIDSSSLPSSSLPSSSLPQEDEENEEIVEDELGGGQVDEETEDFDQDITDLVALLTSLSQVRKYEYKTTYVLNGVTFSAIEHYGEHYYYEENVSDPSSSFGLAEEIETGDVFHFYIDETLEDPYIPSLYEYMVLSSEDPHPLNGLYSAIGITGIHNFTQPVLEELEALRISTNEYYLTSASAYGTFLYMTNYGSSLANSLTGCLLTILDREQLKIQVTLTFGETGTITSVLTPQEETPYDDLDTLIESGEFVGVTSYPDIVTFYEDKLGQDNYTITGSIYNTETYEGGNLSFTAKLNRNFFLIDYAPEYNAQNYVDWGYLYLPSGTSVSLADGTEMTLSYSGCYLFEIQDGKPVVTQFVGPTTTDGTQYIEVETYEDLLSLGAEDLDTNYLYIVKDENYAYRYSLQSDGTMGFSAYMSWFDSVGDFPMDSGSASFYTSSSILGPVAKYYMAKDWMSEDRYFSTDDSLLSTVASTLFAWGYVAGSTTWQNYLTKVETVLNRDEKGEIKDGSLLLHVDQNGADVIFTMNFTDIGTTTIPEVESLYDSLTKGETL